MKNNKVREENKICKRLEKGLLNNFWKITISLYTMVLTVAFIVILVIFLV
jgi:hypothetical protein